MRAPIVILLHGEIDKANDEQHFDLHFIFVGLRSLFLLHNLLESENLHKESKNVKEWLAGVSARTNLHNCFDDDHGALDGNLFRDQILGRLRLRNSLRLLVVVAEVFIPN